MLSLLFRNPKNAAIRFLNQHTVGQRLFTDGNGGKVFKYLRDRGYIRSEEVGPNRWCHEILKKPAA